MFFYFIFLLGTLGTDNKIALPEAIKSDEVQIHEKEKKENMDSSVSSKEKKTEDELRLKISQLFLITLQGTHGTLSGDRNFLSQYTPAGVVIPQIIEPKQAEEYIAGLKFSVRNAELPLWLAGDLYDVIERERGAPSPYINLPPLLALSANPDTANIEKIVHLWESYIQGLKLNMMLGPHLSLASLLPKAHSNLHSLGSNAQTASEVAIQMFNLWNLPRILMVPMDFPGGQTNREGIQPAVLLTPEQYLLDNDVLPYKCFIDKGCPIIHVGTTLVPTLDPQGKPACISRAVIHDWLRKKLSFNGVIIAGPLDAPEVLQFMDPSESALEALRNGADVLYYRGPSNTAGRAIERVCYAVQRQEILASQIEEAYSHIKALKDIQFADKDTPSKEEKGVKPGELTKTGGDIFDDSYYILKNSITLVRNNDNVLPLIKGSVAGIGITGAVGVKELDEALRKYHKNIGLQPMPSSLRLGYLQTFEIERAEKNIGKAPIIICIVVSSLRLTEQEELINRLKEKGSKVVVVVLGHPKALSCAKKADAILIAYAEPPAYQIAIKAIAETLVGFPSFRFRSVMHDISLKPNQPYTFSLKELIAMPPGKLPVSIGDDFPEGASLNYPVETLIKKCVWTIQGK
ncbi:MAG: glycoside hydrolase family 3 N-terminal domain-containing protein, partial [Candidatus Hydrogenedens sp.]